MNILDWFRSPLREENRRLWAHLTFLESRNQQLHEDLVKMHELGLKAMTSELEHAIAIKGLDLERERVEHGFKPKVERALEPADLGEPADLSTARVPGGDSELPDEGQGSPI